jgi:hypothetical protein
MSLLKPSGKRWDRVDLAVREDREADRASAALAARVTVEAVKT